MATSVTVDEVKQVLYLDGTADDELIAGYILAADQFVKNAIGTDVAGFYERDDVAPLFKVAVKARAATLYQYCTELTDNETFPVDQTLNSIVGQLRGVYLVAKEEAADETSDQSTEPSTGAGDDQDGTNR